MVAVVGVIMTSTHVKGKAKSLAQFHQIPNLSHLIILGQLFSLSS